VKCKNEIDSTNNIGKWNHLKIIQKIHVQLTGKARNIATTETAVWGTAQILREILV
jgi:hypothetical protein